MAYWAKPMLDRTEVLVSLNERRIYAVLAALWNLAKLP